MADSTLMRLDKLHKPKQVDTVPAVREIQASIMIVPKNRFHWTGLDMLNDNYKRIEETKSSMKITNRSIKSCWLE